MRTIIVTAALVLAGAVPALGQTSTLEGVFTPEQAARGQQGYERVCAPCHGMRLVAVDDEATNLTGRAFDLIWGGKTLGERLARVSGTMPPPNPGSLDDQTYLDIITYVLSFNGQPAGDAELPADYDILDLIVIEPAP